MPITAGFAPWQTWTDRSGAVQLVSGGYDGAIRRWDPESGDAIDELLGASDSRVAALAIWQDDGPRLASTGADSLIRQWDLESAREIGPMLAGHNGGLWALPPKFGGVTSTPTIAALVAIFAFIAIGTAHTCARRVWGRAVHYLPSDLINGPVIGSQRIFGSSRLSKGSDPLRQAADVGLYLHQQRVNHVIDDLAAHSNELVVFVDDIDRCQTRIAAEVFEATNLFLSDVGSHGGLRARFVISLDSVVVAAYLHDLYQHVDLASISYGDDPSPGWALLRKLIQLPVNVPYVADAGVDDLVNALLSNQQRSPDHQPVSASSGSTEAPQVFLPRAASSINLSDFRAFAAIRLAAQPNRSVREAKRLLNVWKLYAGMLRAEKPLVGTAEVITRDKNLLLPAEIIIRWPAVQPALWRRTNGRVGLSLLVDAVDDDHAWQDAARSVGIDSASAKMAVANLRQLLSEYDGHAVAALAAQLL